MPIHSPPKSLVSKAASPNPASAKKEEPENPALPRIRIGVKIAGLYFANCFTATSSRSTHCSTVKREVSSTMS